MADCALLVFLSCCLPLPVRLSFLALGEPIDRQTIDLMIESVDTDKSGFIDFNEFRQMMREGPQQKD